MTNITTSNNDIYIELEGTEYANSVLAGNIPIPVGTSLELLLKPKVMHPSNILKMRSTANSALHALVVYEISSDASLFGRGYHVGTGNTTFDAFTATGNSVIESIQMVNFSNSIISDATVQTVWVNAANVVQGYFTFNALVPYKSTVDALVAPKVLPAGHKIQISANPADMIDLIVSGKLI